MKQVREREKRMKENEGKIEKEKKKCGGRE